MNFHRVFISRTTVLLAITLGLQWIAPRGGAMLVMNVMLYLAVILMGPTSASLIALLSPWFCYQRGFIAPELASLVPHIIVGNLALILVFYLLFHMKWPAWIRYPSAIGLSAPVRFLALYLPADTFVHSAPTIYTQLNQLLISSVSGILALLLAGLLRRLGVEDYHAVKVKGTL